MPTSYANGLPDMFGAYTEAHQSFQWFKKERKAHRNHDMLQLSPEPAMHSEVYPHERPLNLFFQKVKKNTLLTKFDHPVAGRSRSLMRNQTKGKQNSGLSRVHHPESTRAKRSNEAGAAAYRARDFIRSDYATLNLPDILQSRCENYFDAFDILSPTGNIRGNKGSISRLDVVNNKLMSTVKVSPAGSRKNISSTMQVIENRDPTIQQSAVERWQNHKKQPLTTF